MPADDRIFDQLDRLERGARITRPSADLYRNNTAEYIGYDAPTRQYDVTGAHGPVWEDDGYGFADEPMVLDSFDEQLLRQSDNCSRQTQAALGLARMSLPPLGYELQSMPDFHLQIPAPLQDVPGTSKFELSRSALDQSQYGPLTSSPLRQALPSSPTFNASQRRLLPVDGDISVRPSGHGAKPSFGHNSRFETSKVEQLEQLETRRQDLVPGQAPLPNEFHEPNLRDIQQRTTSKSGSRKPVVQGINLVSTRELPDSLRTVFPYPLFNAVQSKTFDTIYNTNNNFVLSAPTGSGKTAVLELAICRLINTFPSDTYKIVYQAPTKSLCSERQRDWQTKFGPLGLQCAELTGDTDNAHLRNVQQAHIIVTTPEKWDSVTRKWKDHRKLMQMVKLFLIDEVHILKEDRGATLEAVVSRMKSVGSNVRFIALSATVPNSEDIATWLGKDALNPQIPASRERFGEEFRPVHLKKHVVGYQSGGNDFSFDKTLSNKLPELVAKFSQRKPIMIFCFTRGSCLETAKLLSNWWATKSPQDRYWSAPRKRLVVVDKDLRDTITSGVAFHHAGVSIQDRNVIENAYLEGELSVICCTSTLAVGVNLPCHMVVIKNTVTWQIQQGTPGGCKEYSDLEIMQMLGRAGRPQFDDSAVAVIMTRVQRVPYYENMISGQEILESCLHLNLIDHLNAEIGLGTISSVPSAKKWLSGTFLYVRLKENPEHYNIDGDTSGRNLDERLEIICGKAIALLEEHDLVITMPKLRCTDFGDTMARYYVQFETMKLMVALPSKAKLSEILSTLSQAAEFRDIRFRSGEKSVFKDLNRNSSIKFPIPVNLDLPAHKVSLIIQSVLGAVDLPTEDKKHSLEYNTAKNTIFQHATRLVRCIVDCQLYLEDAVTTRNALMLARSIGAMVWDDSPLHMKQLEGIGLVYVHKLVNAGVMSIEDLEATEAERIERALSRNPPFGREVQDKARLFPKLRISVKLVGEPVIKREEHVAVKVKAEIGFLNERIPDMFQRRQVYVCLLAEISDGHKIHFARISAKKLSNGQEVLFSANLTDSAQTIRAYVMCDEIAGTMRHAVLKPDIPTSAFPSRKAGTNTQQRPPSATTAFIAARNRPAPRPPIDDGVDEFPDPDLDNADFGMFNTAEFIDIDTFNDDCQVQTMSKKRKVEGTATTDQNWAPQQLANGKWACNHKCSDKRACKHLCCREGTDNKPKPPRPKENKRDAPDGVSDPKQTQIKTSMVKKAPRPQIASPKQDSRSSKFQGTAKAARTPGASKEVRELNRLHDSVKMKTANTLKLGPGKLGNMSGAASSKKKQPHLSFLEAGRSAEDNDSSDYGSDNWILNDLPAMSDLVGKNATSRKSPPRHDIDDENPRSGEQHAAEEHLPDLGEVTIDRGHALTSSYDEKFEFGDDHALLFNGFGHNESKNHKPEAPPTLHESDGDLGKDNGRLFVGYNTDSASHDLAVNRPHLFPNRPEDAEHLGDPVKYETPPKHAGDALDASAEAVEEWFKANFGTDLFNLVP